MEKTRQNSIFWRLSSLSATMYKRTVSYCLKFRKNTRRINPATVKSSNCGTIIISKCAVCNTKKSRFVKKKKQEDY